MHILLNLINRRRLVGHRTVGRIDPSILYLFVLHRRHLMNIPIEAFCFGEFSFAWRLFRNSFLGIVELTPSGNSVRHIVSSQDDAVAGLKS